MDRQKTGESVEVPRRRRWFGSWTARDVERLRKRLEALTDEDLKRIEDVARRRMRVRGDR